MALFGPMPASGGHEAAMGEHEQNMRKVCGVTMVRLLQRWAGAQPSASPCTTGGAVDGGGRRGLLALRQVRARRTVLMAVTLTTAPLRTPLSATVVPFLSTTFRPLASQRCPRTVKSARLT